MKVLLSTLVALTTVSHVLARAGPQIRGPPPPTVQSQGPKTENCLVVGGMYIIWTFKKILTKPLGACSPTRGCSCGQICIDGFCGHPPGADVKNSRLACSPENPCGYAKRCVDGKCLPHLEEDKSQGPKTENCLAISTCSARQVGCGCGRICVDGRCIIPYRTPDDGRASTNKEAQNAPHTDQCQAITTCGPTQGCACGRECVDGWCSLPNAKTSPKPPRGPKIEQCLSIPGT
jgi:hypothetical protein